MTSPLKERVVRRSPSREPGCPDVWGVYEPDTGSIQYILADPATKKAAFIDVVWNFDHRFYRTDTISLEQVLGIASEERLTVEWVLDTHPHADHLMAAARLKERTGAPIAIGEGVRQISELWSEIYNMPEIFDPDRDFDKLFAHGDGFQVGDLPVRVMLSPGHTLGSVTYVVGDAAFVHDTLMYPDMGTSRTDFPGGDAGQLWDTIQDILALPKETRLFVGHDYGTGERKEPKWEAKVAEHKEKNVHVGKGADRDAWIAKRNERDAMLPLPDRMLAALQVNLRGGRLPESENDGRHYLKLPVNRF